MNPPAHQLTRPQYQALCQREGARPHRASTQSHLVFYLPQRSAWMTARAGRSGTVTVRFYSRCPCNEA